MEVFPFRHDGVTFPPCFHYHKRRLVAGSLGDGDQHLGWVVAGWVAGIQQNHMDGGFRKVMDGYPKLAGWFLLDGKSYLNRG